MFKNYFAETALSVKKIGLALRALVATISGSAVIQGNVKFAFYALVIGAVIDFILQSLPPDKPGTPGTTGATPVNGIAAVILLLIVFVCSCSVIKPAVNTTKSDSTFTSFKQVDIKVNGAKVNAGINLDSLYHASLMERDIQKDDSIARLNIELKYKKDSIAALKANKPLPPKPVYLPSKPDIHYVTDPQTKAQLSYWLDQYGKLQLGCESKDQVVKTLQATITTLRKQITTTTDVVSKTPVWASVVMWIEGISLLICVIILLIKVIL